MRTSRGFSATADLQNSAFSSNFGTTRRWSSRDVELLTTQTFELSNSRHLDNSTTRLLDVLRPSIYTVSQKKKHVTDILYNNFNNKSPITIIFGTVSSQSMRHRKMVSFPHLTSPI